MTPPQLRLAVHRFGRQSAPQRRAAPRRAAAPPAAAEGEEEEAGGGGKAPAPSMGLAAAKREG